MYYYNVRRMIILLFVLFYLISNFCNSTAAANIYRVLLIIAIMLGISRLPRVNFIICTGLFVLGGIILYVNGATVQDWFKAVSNNAGLIALFITAPLMGMPFFYGEYEKDLKNLMQSNMKSPLIFCVFIFVVTHILGIVIMIGAVPLVYGIFIGTARLLKLEKPFMTAILRGYVATGFWSPIWASTAAVNASLKLSWLSIVPYGIFYALVSLAISALFQYYEQTRNSEKNYHMMKDQDVNQKANVKWSSIITMLILFASLIFLIILFDLFTSWQLLIIIPVVSLLFPLASAIVTRKMPAYKRGLLQYYEKNLLKTNNEVILFAAAGFLGKSLEIAKVSAYVPRLIPDWFVQYPFISIIIICTFMIIVSLTGVHPVVTGSSLLGAIDPAMLNFSPLIFGLVIILGWSSAILISPFSATNLIASGLTGEACWNISLRNNGIYGVVVTIIIAFLITLSL